MNLEEGMYVRTYAGYIGKIIDIDNTMWNSITIDTKINLKRKDHYPPNWLFAKESDITKASYDITDLIEKGDYVNGDKVIEKIDDTIYIESSDYIDGKTFVLNSNIKSIVTKEQFKQMEYKVGE